MAKYGNLNCLKYMHEHNCSYDHLVMTNAIIRNNMDCVKYLRITKHKLYEEHMEFAIRYKRIDCMKYLYKHNCPINKKNV